MIEDIRAHAQDEKRWPAPGDKMRFLGENGYPDQLKRAMKAFEVGAEYEVEACDVGDWSHSVRFKGVDGWHNGVMFEMACRSPAAVEPAQGEKLQEVLSILDEIEVGKDNRCHWTEIANAQEKIKAALRSPAAQERLASPGSPERTAELQYEAGMYESLYLAWKERAEQAEAQVEGEKWQDATESKPAEDAIVLGWCIFPAGEECRVVRWWKGHFYAYGLGQNVTHWRPLPSRPSSRSQHTSTVEQPK
jgi:hypothetical protein